MVTFELTKLIVQPVVLKRENGQIVDEQMSPPANLFTLAQITEYYETLVAELDKLNAQQEDVDG